ncbi:unnamed protein product [Strongylus vulgaris]|uniref:Methyltransferase type 11 domain-containing protein n=1 Tax=Strongylus vulgaris TaxID=40348 RepID=A0A3P7KED7_STRVU|nr:unnamed protein product [Strongylus vulgaris]
MFCIERIKHIRSADASSPFRAGSLLERHIDRARRICRSVAGRCPLLSVLGWFAFMDPSCVPEWLHHSSAAIFTAPQSEALPYFCSTLHPLAFSIDFDSLNRHAINVRVRFCIVAHSSRSPVSHCARAALHVAPRLRRGEFDAVVASEIVEHVADLDAFVGGCARLAKSGAPLFFTTINRTLASRVLAIWVAEVNYTYCFIIFLVLYLIYRVFITIPRFHWQTSKIFLLTIDNFIAFFKAYSQAVAANSTFYKNARSIGNTWYMIYIRI